MDVLRAVELGSRGTASRKVISKVHRLLHFLHHIA